MITKLDWEAVHDELITADRRSLGAPPSAEEMLAYLRGELDGEEAERIRELLVAYPELARALTQPFPTEEAKPGQPGYVSDEEIGRQYARLRQRVPDRQEEGGRLLVFWRTFGAIAAMLALVFGTWSFRLARQLGAPQVIAHEMSLQKDEPVRGTAAPTVLSDAREPLQLTVPLTEERSFSEYRLDIVDSGSGRTMWTSGAIQPRTDDTFAVLVRDRYFRPGGKYQVVLYGIAAAAEERLATYTLEVAK